MCLVQKGKQLKLVLNHFGIKFILKYNIYLVVFRGFGISVFADQYQFLKEYVPWFAKIDFSFQLQL